MADAIVALGSEYLSAARRLTQGLASEDSDDHRDRQAERWGTATAAQQQLARDNRNQWLKFRKVFKRMPDNGLFLELGCGAGVCAGYFNSVRAGHYLGLDLAPALLQEGTRRHRHRNWFAAADVAWLPLADASIDGIFGVAIVHHFQHPEKVLAECYRSLRPGGIAAFSEPHRIAPNNLYQAIRHPGTEIGVLRMSRGNLARWFRQAGFIDVEISHFIYTPSRPRWSVFDTLEVALPRVPLLRYFSVCLAVSGRKPSTSPSS